MYIVSMCRINEMDAQSLERPGVALASIVMVGLICSLKDSLVCAV